MAHTERVNTLRKSFISRTEIADRMAGEHHRTTMMIADLLANSNESWLASVNERRQKVIKYHSDARDGYSKLAATAQNYARRAANVYRSRVNRLNTGQPTGFMYHVRRELGN